jgi:hypothetical protein
MSIGAFWANWRPAPLATGHLGFGFFIAKQCLWHGGSPLIAGQSRPVARKTVEPPPPLENAVASSTGRRWVDCIKIRGMGVSETALEPQIFNVI